MEELNTRFMRVTTPAAVNFDPIYVLATYLHPRYALMLDDDLLKIAKRELELMVRPYIEFLNLTQTFTF